ncbi:MAG: PD-(D/E)XK nuclease family protein [Candidatus Polarisedimenticolia bacterium]
MTMRHRGLRLVVGPPAPAGGLEEAFFEEARRLQGDDPLRPVVVLAGSNFQRLRLRRLLALRLAGGHANIRFELLRDFAADLGGGLLRDRGRRRIPDEGRDLVLRAAVQAHAHGTYFERIALMEGFVEALGATFTDLKEAEIEPALLRAAGAGMRASGARRGSVHEGMSGRKLEDLAALYEAYDDLLQDRRFYDDGDLFHAAIAAAAARGASPEPAPPVLVYGFYDLNWQQRALLREALAFRQATVFFPFEADDPDNAWEFARPLLEWFRGWIPESRELPAPHAPGAKRLPPEVSILAAPGEGREVAEALRWMIGLARDRSLPFGSMGLLYRSSDPYRHLVSEAMAEAGGVPHFMADGLSLARTAAARALVLMLQARSRADNMSRRTVMDVLALTDTSGQAAQWDRLSREAGVVRGTDWRRRLERLAAQDTGAARAARALADRVDELHAALQAMPGGGRWSDLAAAAIDLLHRFVPASLSPDPVGERLQTLGALDEIHTPVSLEDFTQRVRSLLERSSEPWGEFERSGIFVGGVMDARLLSFDAVAVVGLVEKGFPVPVREDPILLDDERETINNLVREPRLALKRRRLDEERLLFRLASSSATQSVRLSFPRVDPTTARPRNASPFLLRLAGTLTGASVDYESLERTPGYESVSLSALGPARAGSSIMGREFDLCVLRREAPRAADPDVRRRLLSFLKANPLLSRAMEAEQARWGEARFTAHDGVILRPHMAEHVRALHPLRDRPLSPTRIERYAMCPLRYFLGDVLGLEELHDPEEAEQIDPRRRGGLVHRILFEQFTALRDRAELPLRRESVQEAIAMLRETAARVFQQAEEEGITGPRMVWEVDKERIVSMLETMLESEAEEADWLPAHFELGFAAPRFEDEGEDEASSENPVVAELRAGQPIPLKGRIDRVDVSHDRKWLRVTDYKTGKGSSWRVDALKGGTTVQIPLYMLAAESLLQGRYPGARCAEGRYQTVGGEGRTVGFSAEALARRREDLGLVLGTFLLCIERGIFLASPGEQCRWCSFQLACGEGREARFERKKHDATAQDYLLMRDLP